MELLVEDYEIAPENEVLKRYYHIDPNETDYYAVRTTIDKLLFNTYLFYPDTGYRLFEKMDEVIENRDDDDYIVMYINDLRDNFLNSKTTHLLSLYGKEWLAEMLGEEHPCYDDIRHISNKINGLFLYKGQDDENVWVEHIASGKRFLMTKESFDHHRTLKEIDTIVLLGIVKWQDRWWFSGVFTQVDFSADIVLDQKNSVESRKQVDFLNYGSQEQLRLFLSKKVYF